MSQRTGLLQNADWKMVTPPGALVDNATVTSSIIDTAQYGFVDIAVLLGATDIALTALKVTHDDDSAMGAPSDVSGLVYGTSLNPDTGATAPLPTADDDNKIYGFCFSTIGLKRYVRVVATVGNGDTGAYVAILAALSARKNDNHTAALRGVAANLIR
jgi:hypothetical protein